MLSANFKKMFLLTGIVLLFVGCSLSKISTGRLHFVAKGSCLNQVAEMPHNNSKKEIAAAAIASKKQAFTLPLVDSTVSSQGNVKKDPIQQRTGNALKNTIELKTKRYRNVANHRQQFPYIERSNSEKLKAAKNAFLAESIIYAVLSVLSLPFSLLILTWGGSIFGFVITALGVVATILSIALFIRAKKLLMAYNEYEAHQQDYDDADSAAKPEMKGDPKALYILSRVGLVPIVLVFILIIFTLLIL